MPPIREAMTVYFDGEKNAGLVLFGIGVAVFVAAAVLFPARFELRSLAWTLVVFGLLELAIGMGLYLKTGPQVANLSSRLADDRAALLDSERQRMVKVQNNFVTLERVWALLIVGSTLVAIARKTHVTLSGVALGVLVNTAVFLTFDVVAERRGRLYLEALTVATS
jgi:hypothetical protein